MAGVVLRAASAGGGSGVGDIGGMIVGLAEAGAKLSDIARQEAEKLKEQARNDDNEFNIRKQFLDNAIASIRTATFDQYNIVICTDQEHDDFQNLQGQILPLDLIDVEVRKDVYVNFQVYIFDTGKYLRHGKWERDHWSWWGENKKWTDPAAMHVHFENAQPKKNADEIKALMDKQAADQKAAADADAATKKAEADSKAANEAAIKAEADRKAKEAQQNEDGDITEQEDEDGGEEEEEDENEGEEQDREEEEENQDEYDDDGLPESDAASGNEDGEAAQSGEEDEDVEQSGGDEEQSEGEEEQSGDVEEQSEDEEEENDEVEDGEGSEVAEEDGDGEELSGAEAEDSEEEEGPEEEAPEDEDAQSVDLEAE